MHCPCKEKEEKRARCTVLALGESVEVLVKATAEHTVMQVTMLLMEVALCVGRWKMCMWSESF